MFKKIVTVVNPSYKSDKNLNLFINKIPLIFEKQGNILYNKRNLIKSFTIEGDKDTNELIVKRYKKPNIIQQIVYGFFKTSKAKRAFLNSQKLRERGIDTPKEIAYIEIKKYRLFKYGYYISAPNYNKDIAENLTDKVPFDKELAHAFALFVVELHLKGILHHDLNSTNVLFHKKENNVYHFSLIDINRMKFNEEEKQISKSICFNNLTRFTGDLNLFAEVIKTYAHARNWDIKEAVHSALQIKNKHDLQWKRRKRFFHFFKRLMNKK